jgi:serpin B
MLAASLAMAQTQAVSNTQIAASAQNGFGLKLLTAITAADPRRNVFVSPSSVFLALGMLELGAAGETRASVRRTLQVPPEVSESDLHNSTAALSQALRQARPGVEISIANAVWADRHISLAADYVARCRTLYQADAETLDFHSPGAADTINAWVMGNTGGKIDNLVSERAVAASDTILTNAVYFKGKWNLPFDPDRTGQAPFHLADQSLRTVALMHRSGLRNAYRAGAGYEAAILPYEGASLVAAVILPAAGKQLEEVMAQVDLAGLLAEGEASELDLRLPRFTLDYSVSLKPALLRMGMGIAFQFPGAEFAPMGSPLFYVGDVLHKTRLEVDEQGTVAAAATAILVPAGAAMRPVTVPQKVMVVDRPFGLLICDRSSRAVLFAGVIYEP